MVGGRGAARHLPALLIRAAVLAALASLALRPVAAADRPTGAIRGTVTDKDFGSPLGQVRVTIVEALMGATTSADGHYLIERVPAGTYTVSFAKNGYDRLVVNNVAIPPGQITELSAELSSEVVELDEMVVTAAELPSDSDIGLLEIRAAATSVQDALSSEMIRKSGASDVAGALRLIVGTSVVDGKYATVRGLSDRYTGATLNGVRVPSADPRRRAVQMDLFPTGTVESVTVYKTFSPDLQGDFTGGGVDIRTKATPDGPTFSTSVTVEDNTQATGNPDYLTYLNGGVGEFGREADRHALPEIAEQPLPDLPRYSRNPTPDDYAAANRYDRLVRAFDPVMGVTRDKPGPNAGMSLVGGDRFELGGGVVLGALGALSYARKSDFYEDGQNNTGGVSIAGQPVGLTKPRTDAKGTSQILEGFLGSLDLKLSDDHDVTARLIYNQAAEDEARYQEEDTGYPSVEQNQSLHYTQRTVSSAQISGTHAFDLGTAGGSKLEIHWTGASNRTSQDEPDVRFFRNTYDYVRGAARMPSNSTDAKNTRRIFRRVDESGQQGQLDVTLPFLQWTGTEAKIKAGLFADRSNRAYEQHSFTYRFENQFGSIFDPAVGANRALATFTATHPGQLWTDVFLNPDRIGLATNHPPAPDQLLWTIVPLGDDVDYTGDQSITAYYAMTELPLVPKVKLTAGARYETTELTIDPVNPIRGTVEVVRLLPSGDRALETVPQAEATSAIDEGALLPAAGLTWEIAKGMNLRANWSRTIARPTFREMAPVATEEFIFGDEFLGNPDLTLSKSTNLDLRWEWFPGKGDVLAVSLFRKSLRDPIELISFSAGGRTFVQPQNFPEGKVKGFELEGRLSIDRIFRPLAGLSVGANYTYIDSEVSIPPGEQLSLSAYGFEAVTRRLQGQPSYLVNASISYDNDKSGTSAGVFFSRIGETLQTGAARGTDEATPDVFELPYDTLDAKVSQKLGKGFTLSAKAGNLLKPPRTTVYRAPVGDDAIHTTRPTGATIGVTAGWNW